MSGTRPFRMLARMPDDVPRDMPHMDETFPGRRAFIPSNSGKGGRCSLVRRKRTPASAQGTPSCVANETLGTRSATREARDMPQGPHTSRETGQHYQNSRCVASRLRALRLRD
jgi:hypothetical protein